LAIVTSTADDSAEQPMTRLNSGQDVATERVCPKMFFLCTRHIHPSRPLGYHAPVASNTSGRYPDSTPTQYSSLYPTQTALPPHPVPCSTCTSVPILPPRPVPHLLHRPRRHIFGQPNPHATCNEPSQSLSPSFRLWPPFSFPLSTDPHMACTPLQHPRPNAENQLPHNTYHPAVPIPTPRPAPYHVVHSSATPFFHRVPP